MAKLNYLYVEDEATLRTPGGGNGRREVKWGTDLLIKAIHQAIKGNPNFKIIGGKQGEKADVGKIQNYKVWQMKIVHEIIIDNILGYIWKLQSESSVYSQKEFEKT